MAQQPRPIMQPGFEAEQLSLPLMYLLDPGERSVGNAAAWTIMILAARRRHCEFRSKWLLFLCVCVFTGILGDFG